MVIVIVVNFTMSNDHQWIFRPKIFPPPAPPNSTVMKESKAAAPIRKSVLSSRKFTKLMLKLVTGDEQNWVWKGKRRHFGTMLPRRWEIRKMEEVVRAEIFLQFIFHLSQIRVCSDFIAGVKRPFMRKDPSWIFCLWGHPSSRHLLYYGEPTEYFENIFLTGRSQKSTSLPRENNISGRAFTDAPYTLNDTAGWTTQVAW